MQRNIFGNASDFLTEKCCTTLLWCTGLSQSMPLRSRRASFLPIFDCCFLSNTRTVISRSFTLHPMFAFQRYIVDGDRGCSFWEHFIIQTNSLAHWSHCNEYLLGYWDCLCTEIMTYYGLSWPVIQANTRGCVDMIGYVWESPGSDWHSKGRSVHSFLLLLQAEHLVCHASGFLTLHLSVLASHVWHIPKWFWC